MKPILITAILLCTTILNPANAQEDKQPQRKGFVFGASYGVGHTIVNFPDKKQSELNLALDVKLGYMIKPDLAILLTSNVSVYNYSGYGRDRKRDFGILAPSIQYWANRRLWLLGGVGVGGDNPVFWDIDHENINNDPLETTYFSGLGIVSAIGFEVYQHKNFAIDLKSKITYRNVKIQQDKTTGVSFAVLLGISLY